jgi:hypothetical protein
MVWILWVVLAGGGRVEAGHYPTHAACVSSALTQRTYWIEHLAHTVRMECRQEGRWYAAG